MTPIVMSNIDKKVRVCSVKLVIDIGNDVTNYGRYCNSNL